MALGVGTVSTKGNLLVIKVDSSLLFWIYFEFSNIVFHLFLIKNLHHTHDTLLTPIYLSKPYRLGSRFYSLEVESKGKRGGSAKETKN